MKSTVSAAESAGVSPAARLTQAGFTLLEIMVAIVVLTLILASAFGALRLGDRSWQAGLEHASQTENLRTVSGVLQRIFGQVLPLRWSEQARTYIAFNGSSEQVRFIAPAPQHHGATGLFEYTLSLQPGVGSSRLLLHYRVHDPGMSGFTTDNSESQQLVLAEALKSASFAYYGSPVATESPQWHTHWDSEAETFPRQVKVRIVALDKQLQWPELLLTLHANPIQ